MSESESHNDTERIGEYPNGTTGSIPELTEEERGEIYEQRSEFVLSTGCRHSRIKLHLAAEEGSDDPEPFCIPPGEYGANDWRATDTACFPPGYRDICLSCVARWRREQ